MKVLLLEDVKGVGQAGEVRDVADGYFRNYLAPQKLATPATEATLRRVADQRAAQARREARAAAENRTLGERIGRTQVDFRVRVGEQHRLYGSITSADIAEKLGTALGQPIDKRDIELEEPIRHLGTYKVTVHLARDVEPKVTVVVEREEEEGAPPAQA